MTKHFFQCFIFAVLVNLWLSSAVLAQDGGNPIAQETIDALKTSLLKQQKEDTSSARQRLAVKRLIRDAGKLIEANPAAPNRFEILAIVFKAQQRLFGMDDSSRNRESLLETCKDLVKAPDNYADLRFEADILVTQTELARQGADAETRLAALKPMVDRYRDTPADAKMLRTAMVMALELGDPRMIKDIREQMTDRFAGDLDMINFQREKLGGQVFGAPFCGTFERSDGEVMHLPADILGQTTVLYFWTTEEHGKKDFDGLVAHCKAHKADMEGRIRIISFNVDQLPDAGEKILRDNGVDWPALHLPEGRENRMYKTFARKDTAMVTLTPTGYAALVMAGSTRRKVGDDGTRDHERWFQSSLARDWSRERYVSQLCSLFAGDFFIIETEGEFNPSLPPELKSISKPIQRTIASVPEKTLKEIQACFIKSPLRYRATFKEIQSAYQKASKLCSKAIADHPNAPDLWIVRNRLIVAQLGLWKLTTKHAYYLKAIEESKSAVDTDMPKGADIIARFCLAKESLRDPQVEPEPIIRDFVQSSGGKSAPGLALAAASMLALDVADPDLHDEYRELILTRHIDDPTLWTYASFLIDRYHRYWIFRVPFTAGWSYGRRQQWILGQGHLDPYPRRFKTELKTLDGKPFRIPQDCSGKWTVILFTNSWVENEKSPLPSAVTRYLNPYIDKRALDDMQVIVAVLDEKTGPVEKYLKEKPLGCQTMVVQGGLENPLVQQLGILDEDQQPNALVLRPDGSIAITISGLTMSRTRSQLIPNLIDRQDEQAVVALLESGKIDQAKELIFKIAPPFDPEAVDERGRKLRKPVYNYMHIRARAKTYVALEDWDAALVDAEEVANFLTSKGGWMSMRPVELDEAELLVEMIRAKQEPTKK
ncbi:MAG: hypothetical protein OSA89_18195 [Mariniblastus sp.]|nr:hypothetical protein [Mariniblastus sp.]